MSVKSQSNKFTAFFSEKKAIWITALVILVAAALIVAFFLWRGSIGDRIERRLLKNDYEVVYEINNVEIANTLKQAGLEYTSNVAASIVSNTGYRDKNDPLKNIVVTEFEDEESAQFYFDALVKAGKIKATAGTDGSFCNGRFVVFGSHWTMKLLEDLK